MDSIKKFIHKWAWVLLAVYCVVGIFYPLIGLAALICMLAPSVVAIFRGRMWCGNFCPRGSFNDVILSKISMKRPVPKVFKKTWFRLIFFSIVMGFFAIQMVFAWGSLLSVAYVFIRTIIITTVITVILGIAFNQRTWCMICPMGTMAHYVSKSKFAKSKMKQVSFERDKCVDCKICSKNCPIGIDVLSHKKEGKVTDVDCLKCNVCVEKCPKKSLNIA